ncbi:Cell division protein kinase 5, partial [Caligus rogercresseyi]
LLVRMKDVVKTDDVLMFELLEEADLTESRGRDALVIIGHYLLRFLALGFKNSAI